LRFSPDVAAADDRRLRGRAFPHVAGYAVGVGQEAQGEDAVEASALDRRKDGPGAGRDHEPVVGVFELLPRGEILDDKPLVPGVYALDPMAGEDLDVLLGEVFGGAGHEGAALFDHAGDKVRQPALANGDLRFFLVDGYLQFGIQPASPGGGLRTRCHPSDHDQTHLSNPFRSEDFSLSVPEVSEEGLERTVILWDR
jgi:hypothetical protein